MTELSQERREELAKAGDHGPDVCDCDAYAPDNGYPDDLVCDGLAASFALIAGWFTAEREAGAAEVRARVEAALDQLSASVPLRGSHKAWVYVEDLRAALNGDVEGKDG